MFKKVNTVIAMLSLMVVVLVTAVSAVNYGHQLYSSGTVHAEYTRVIKLANGNLLASHSIKYGTNNWAIKFYRSTNNGETFTPLPDFTDTAESGKAIGGPTIYEASPGNILLSYTVWNDNAYEDGQKLKVWKSTNGGSSWTYLATLESGVWVWEPEFTTSSDGKLQLYYSYAPTLKANNLSIFDQVIVRKESSNGGATWSSSRITAVGNSNDNVGMPRIVKVNSSLYYMAFEYYDDNAAVHVVSSTDGKNWGTSMGPTMEVPWDGWMFSTPALTYANGALIGMGKTYNDWWWGSDENNGKVVLVSEDGGQTWAEMAAPFEIRFNDDHSNWSPTLLPLSSSQLFMITTSDTSSAHEIRYDTGPISIP